MPRAWSCSLIHSASVRLGKIPTTGYMDTLLLPVTVVCIRCKTGAWHAAGTLALVLAQHTAVLVLHVCKSLASAYGAPAGGVCSRPRPVCVPRVVPRT